MHRRVCHVLLAAFCALLVFGQLVMRQLVDCKQSGACQSITFWETLTQFLVVEGPMGKANSTLGPSRQSHGAVSKSEVSEPVEACPVHHFIDDWNATPGGKTQFLLLADNGGQNGARFGNQLFTSGWSIMKALELGWPLVVIPHNKQIHKLPCLRSSHGADEALAKMCGGCNQPPNLWSDRNESCNGGNGCGPWLQRKGIVRNLAGGAFWQNLREWPSLPSLTVRQVLEPFFNVPLPKLQPPVELPGSDDLVMHFRAYGLLFEEIPSGYRLQVPPFDFWKWTVEHHRNATGKAAHVWLVTEPSLRTHPTVLRLKHELGVQVFTGMDAMGKDGWMGDFAWLRKASALALSFSTFSWWAGYIGKASTIYLVLPPMEVPLKWCQLLPPADPRYVFYDFYKAEAFTDGEKAIQRCKEFEHCTRRAENSKKSCPAVGQNFLNLLHRHYPEVLSSLGGRAKPFLLMSKIKQSLARDATTGAKGDQ